MKPVNRAVLGFSFVIPFVLLNAIVANEIEPLFSFIRPGVNTNLFEYILLFSSIFLMPIGAYISSIPLLKKKINSKKRTIYFLNIIVSLTLILIFIVFLSMFAEEIYRCDILKLVNCD